MATATSPLLDTPHAGEDENLQADHAADLLAGSSPAAFIKFDDNQATVFVNSRHIVRLEYNRSTGRAHLQLSDGHHYYLSDKMAMHVTDQLQKHQRS